MISAASLRKVTWVGLVALAFLHALDLATTRVGIARGVLIEANPLAGPLVSTWWAVVAKTAGLLLLAVFALRHSNRVSAALLVWCGVGWYAAVVATNALIAGGVA